MVVGVLATRREPDRLLRTKPSRRLGVHTIERRSAVKLYASNNNPETGCTHGTRETHWLTGWDVFYSNYSAV